MNSSIKELKNKKINKIKHMSMEEAKQYIQRSIAYYYSHYTNFELNYDNFESTVEVYEDAKRFKDSFNENIQLLLDSINNNYGLDAETKQIRNNFIVATLYQSITENLILNSNKNQEVLEKILHDMESRINYDNMIYTIFIGFNGFVQKADTLFIECQKFLMILYELVSPYHKLQEISFNRINRYFEDLFEQFYMNYLTAKKHYSNLVMLHGVMIGSNSDELSFEDYIDMSDEMKFLMDKSFDTMLELDKNFQDLVKDNDLFSFPKSVFTSELLDNTLCYDLRYFDVIGIDDESDKEFSETYNRLKELENTFGVHILFDTDDTTNTTNTFDSVDETIIDDMNINELEDLFL